MWTTAAPLDVVAVRAAFDLQARRDVGWQGTGGVLERIEVDGRLRVVRFVATPGMGRSVILWSDLSDLSADRVDGLIAEQASFFAGRGLAVEWKHYSHDLPADLPDRLVRNGFEAEDAETLVVAEAADLARDVDRAGAALPPGVRLVEVLDDAGLARVSAVAAAAFGADPHSPDHVAQYAGLSAQLREAPRSLVVLLAMAGDEPVSQARVEFPPTGQFAGLWGGGTVPQWRGHGIYRALVAHRAALAAARGYRYVTVDASASSEPILTRLGLTRLAVTTPFVRQP